MVAELDAALASFAQVVKRDTGQDVLDIPGAGAAGGLGAGLIAFAGANLRSGIDMVCQVLDFDRHLEGADLVFTGEGRADLSTVFDKAPVGVARHAKAYGVPTVLLAGSLGEGHEELYDHGVASVLCISDGAMTFQGTWSDRRDVARDGGAGCAAVLDRSLRPLPGLDGSLLS